LRCLHRENNRGTKKEFTMKETRIKIKIETTKEIVYCGDYCSNECDFISSTKCILFKKFIEYVKGTWKPVRCDDCKERYK